MFDLATLFERSYESVCLKCPVCGDNKTHLERAYALEADPATKADPEGQSIGGELYGIPVGGVATGWRRGTLVIEVSCEQGQHLFQIHFQQHKGSTFVFTKQEVIA